LVWLRQVAIAIHRAQRLEVPLTAGELHNVCVTADVNIPGLIDQADEESGGRAIGKLLGKIFLKGDSQAVENYRIQRSERQQSRTVNETVFKQRIYTFFLRQT
jgi:Tfp pilus assembly protein PilN